MYYRIKNKLDAEVLAGTLKGKKAGSIISERVYEIIKMLDDAYGERRKSYDMGGYVLLFPDVKSYQNENAKVRQFYHLEDCEYAEIIVKSNNANDEWWEELYMLSSDDALVLVYPKSVVKNER